MGNLAAADITTTVEKLTKLDSGERLNFLTIAFGDGAKTYPAGGIPISGGAFGCPNFVRSLIVFDNGISAYEWSYDKTAKKLVAKRVAAQAITGTAHTHDVLIKGGQAASTTNDVAVYTAVLGKEAATDATILGSASATSGGVVSTTAASTAAASSMAEPSTVAIAAQTLKIQVQGW